MDPRRITSSDRRWFGELGDRFRSWWPAKLVGTPLGMTLFFVAYFWLLRHPRGAVTVMPLTPIDHLIGFQPLALPLYVSLWLYVTLASALVRIGRELASLAVAAVALSVAGLGIFRFWPTSIPAADVDWASHPGFLFLKSADAAGNACPSLHVAFAVFSGLWLERLWREMRASAAVRAANWAWCVGIVYSTMAVRQHVFADVVAGAALGVAAAWANFRWLRAARPPPANEAR
jgi:membrane-associated phospholipid phosphatase